MKYKRKQPVAQINIVPYIDVMLVLLVIFMITAPLLSQGVQVQLPHAQAKTLPPQQQMPIIVSIDQAGDYYLNVAPNPRQPIALDQLMVRVAAMLEIDDKHHDHRDVYVKGDRDVNYGKIVELMATLQRAGANQVGLITDSNQEVKQQ